MNEVDASILERKYRYILYMVTLFSSFLPVYTAVSIFQQQDMSLVVMEVMVAMSEWLSPLAPAIHVSFLIILVLLYYHGKSVSRFANLYFALLFTFLAVTNSIAVTESYGLTVLFGNLVPMLVVALYWFWEAYRPRNVYHFQRLPLWRYWMVPLAALSFWFPMSIDRLPDFNPILLITSDFGITFCPTTPVVLALLVLIYPNVNRELLSITSLVGLMIGLFNILSFFIMSGYTLWLLILHTPLIFISLYGLVIPRLVSDVESMDS
jgi:hypothetical protein